MTLIRRTAAAAALLAPLVVAAGCGDEIGDFPPPRAYVTDPASIVASPGDTVRIRVSAHPHPRNGLALRFESTGGAAVVDSAGLVTAVAPGTAVVLITDAQRDQPTTVAVPVTVRGMALAPGEATIAQGGEVTLRPTFVGAEGLYGALRWESSDTTVAVVDGAGVVRGVRGGRARISAVSTAGTPVRGTATVSVVCAAPLISELTVRPTAVTLPVGATQQLEALVLSGMGRCLLLPPEPSTDVTYASSDTTVATVSATGLLTARAPGTASVVVRSRVAPDVSQTVSVTVRAPASGPALLFAAITAGDPLVPVDLRAVRGAIRVEVGVHPDVARGPARVEPRLAGRAVGEREVPEASNDASYRTVSFVVSTAARDAAGAPLHPNGERTLEAVLSWGCATGVAGCVPQRAQVQQRLTLANP